MKKHLSELLRADKVKALATTANRHMGEQMTETGEVVIEINTPYRVKGRVKPYSGQIRTVELLSTDEGLKWHCTCTSRPDYFCNHCVAMASALTHS